MFVVTTPTRPFHKKVICHSRIIYLAKQRASTPEKTFTGSFELQKARSAVGNFMHPEEASTRAKFKIVVLPKSD